MCEKCNEYFIGPTCGGKWLVVLPWYSHLIWHLFGRGTLEVIHDICNNVDNLALMFEFVDCDDSYCHNRGSCTVAAGGEPTCKCAEFEDNPRCEGESNRPAHLILVL